MESLLNYLAIVQARMGSTRLSNKVLQKINDTLLIEILLARLSRAKKVDKIILATSINEEHDSLAEFVSNKGYSLPNFSESCFK